MNFDFVTIIDGVVESEGSMCPPLPETEQSPCGTGPVNALEYWTDPATKVYTASGAEIQFRAYARQSDGSVVEVTNETLWVSEDDEILAFSTVTKGLATVIFNPENGQSPVTDLDVNASYAGFFKIINVEIIKACDTCSADVVLIVDNSLSNTALSKYKEEITAFINASTAALFAGRLRLGIVTCSAKFPQVKKAKLETQLTSSKTSLLAVVNAITTDQYFQNVSYEDAFEIAAKELQSARHRVGTTSLIVLLGSSMQVVGEKTGMVQNGESFSSIATDYGIKVAIYHWLWPLSKSSGSGLTWWGDPEVISQFSTNATDCMAFLVDSLRGPSGFKLSPATRATDLWIPSLGGHLFFAVNKLELVELTEAVDGFCTDNVDIY